MNRNLLISILLIVSIHSISIDLVMGQNISPRSRVNEQLLEKRAASLARLGRAEEAVDLYLEILYKNPQNANVYFRISSLLPGKENAPVLMEVLEDIMKTQPGNTRLAAERGRLLYILDRKQEAVQEWQRLIEEHRKDRYVYTTLSNAMLQAGAIDEAIQQLLEGRLALSEPGAFALDLARIYAAKHDYDLASQEYLHHLDKNPGMLEYISNQLIRLLENEGSFQLINKNIAKMIARPGNHQIIILSQAKLLLHQQLYAECAQTILSSDVSRSLDDVMAIADELLAEQAWVPAADLYLFISANSTDKRQAGRALLNLASTYEHRLQREDAYKSLSGYFPGNQFFAFDVRIPSGEDASLERTLKLYDSLQILLPKTQEAFLASYHIAEIQLMLSGDVDRAIRGFQNVFTNANRREIQLAGGQRLVDAWLVKCYTTAAINALNKIAKELNIDEDSPQIIATRIKLRIHQGDLLRLKKELLNLSGAASPMNQIFNDGLELMALLDGNGFPDDRRLEHYLKAERLIGQHKLTEAAKVLQSIQGDSDTIADEAEVRAIQIYLILREYDEAISAMDAFLEHFATSPWRANVLVWRGEQIQYGQNEPQLAIPYYEEVIVNHPEYLGIQDLRIRLRNLIGGGS